MEIFSVMTVVMFLCRCERSYKMDEKRRVAVYQQCGAMRDLNETCIFFYNNTALCFVVLICRITTKNISDPNLIVQLQTL